MNYTLHYNKLIDRARNRELEGYSERHHIIPRCMGGSDDENNLVRLTPEEHYVAHQLLFKMHPHNPKLAHAAFVMTRSQNGKRSNKLYSWVRRAHAEAMSNREITDEFRKNCSASALKRKQDPVKVAAGIEAAKLKNKNRKVWNKGLKGAQVAWNKGLSADTDKRVAKYSSHEVTDQQRLNCSIAAKKREAKKKLEGFKSPLIMPWEELSYKSQKILHWRKSDRVPAGWTPKSKEIK